MINCGLSEPLRRYLQQGIRAVFNSDTALRSHLERPEEPCQSSYTGQRGLQDSL